jgi:hypothetical protein
MPTFLTLSPGLKAVALSSANSAQLSPARSRFLPLLPMKFRKARNDQEVMHNFLTGPVARV